MEGVYCMPGRKNLGRIVAVLLAIGLLAAACGDDDESGSGGGTPATGVTCATAPAIGFFGALTGNDANLGINIKRGVELAVEQWNAANAGCKVTLKDYDSQGDPQKAPALADQAIADKTILGIVGPAFSGESKAVNPKFDQAVLPIITASATNPDLSKNGWKIFHRMLATDAKQGPDVAKYIRDTMKAKSVFVIDDQSEYGKGIADQVRTTLGALATGTDSIDPKASDYSAAVTKVKTANPDAVFYGGYYNPAGNLVKQLRDGGVKATFISGDGSADQGFIKAGGPASKDAIISCPCNINGNAAFLKAYKAKFNDDPRTYGAEAYDAANSFFAAFAAGKLDRASINTFLATYDAEGASRRIKWNATGEVEEYPTFIFKSDGKTLVKVDEVA
jgi:branched-chain amino acid transport system substrate-binding protein